MRAFIAIELPEDIKKHLAVVQKEPKKLPCSFKWVQVSNIHLTLKFLGDISEEISVKIKNILEKVSVEFEPFQIQLGKIGAFPRMEYPRVLWVGLEDKTGLLANIYAKLEKNLAGIGIAEESRLFHPHLTLARTKIPRKVTPIPIKIPPDAIFKVTQLTLFQSTLTPKGPIYSVLHKTSLKSDF